MCSTSLAYVPTGPTSQQGRGEGGREGKEDPSRGESGECLPYMGTLGEPNSASALPGIYLSVILQHCFWSLLKPVNIVLAASDHKEPEQDGIRVHLPPWMGVGRKAVLHLWYLFPVHLYTPF